MKPVFIVGQWKCGTTWLLNILSAHPQVLGVDEVDVIRCTYNFENDQRPYASAPERLNRFFNLSGWSLYYDKSGWKNRDVVGLLERGQCLPRFESDSMR